MFLKRRPFLIFLIFPLIALACSGMGAEEQAFAASPVDDLITAASIAFASITFLPAALAAIFSLLEHLKLIDPDKSDIYIFYVNVGIYVLAFAAVLFGQTNLLALLNHYLGGITPILTALLLFLTGTIHSIARTRLTISQFRMIEISAKRVFRS